MKMAYREKKFGEQLVDEFKLGFKLGVNKIIKAFLKTNDIFYLRNGVTLFRTVPSFNALSLGIRN